jgi:serine/threonine-protein kinase
MAEAIDHAHSMQIIHRDICPEHFIVGKNNWGQDVCKLVNFGLAKVLGGLAESTRSDAALSGAAVVQGSPYTVSPEVAAGDEYGPAADVYSLGVTLYYMLTGKMPFESRSPHALIVAHMTKTPPSFAERVPTVWVPENVERVIMKVLSKNPKDRPQSAGELAQSFREAVGNFREGNDPTSSGLETKSQVSAKAKTVRSPSRNDVGIRIVPRAPARNNNQAGHAFSTPVYALVSLAILVVLMAYLLRT